MKTFLKSTLSILIAVAVALVINAAIVDTSARTPVAMADGLGGIFGQNLFPAVRSGLTSYTTTTAYSDPINVQYYGSVQIAVSNATTSTGLLTITPQFNALQSAACAFTTGWYTATHYMDYQPYSVASNGTTITETVGAWTATPVLEQLGITGANSVAREISAQGSCVRLMFTWSLSGTPYTPTANIRGINRN